jgi:hypothetical protein
MRRHRERGVLNQHGKDRVDISGLECIGEAAHEIADSSIAEGTQGCLPVRLGEPLAGGLAGALQRAVHRLHAAV